MIDIDYFEKYNDAYGHLQGDECLRAMAVEFQRSVRRPQDMVVRFGGEEFVVLLPQSGKEAAIHVAKRLFRNVNSLYSKYSPVQLKSQMTISVGIASLGTFSIIFLFNSYKLNSLIQYFPFYFIISYFLF